MTPDDDRIDGEAAARMSALRVVERIERERRPRRPMPDGWHRGPQAFAELDAGHSLELRERWHRALHG